MGRGSSDTEYTTISQQTQESMLKSAVPMEDTWTEGIRQASSSESQITADPELKQGSYSFIVVAAEAGKRLDCFLEQQLSLAEATILRQSPERVSRNLLQDIITNGGCQVSGKPMTRSAYRIKLGEQVQIQLPTVDLNGQLTPKAIALDILYEDQDLLVINKPAGMIVHPSNSTHQATLVHALLYHCPQQLSGLNGPLRPGIVHRLDKDTSGVMVVAKNDRSHEHLASQLKEQQMRKQYLSVCWGVPTPASGTICANLARHATNRLRMHVVKEGGKVAITHYKVQEILWQQLLSLVECQLETGRTHQIRVHFSYLGHPLVGDPQYCRSKAEQIAKMPTSMAAVVSQFRRQALHAQSISFIHPTSGQEMHFTAPLPTDLQQLIAALRG